MKKTLLIIVALLCVYFSYAKSIQSDKAKLIALNWMNSVDKMVYDENGIATVFTKSDNGIPVYYLVSFKPVGWVIVSASDLAQPIIGYSTESTFDQDKMPEQVAGWMGAISSEIATAEKKKILPSPEIQKNWNYWGKALSKNEMLKSASLAQIGPLTSSNWNQGRFYNEMAPFDSRSTAGNDHVWIGCVATSMAQIMKYWSYPATGMGYHSYVHSDYGNLSADFENSTYNWSAMPNNVNSQNIDVQRISYHSAVAAEMDFGPSASGAYLSDAQRGFINHFRYNTAIFESSKSRWDESEWIALLKRELDAGRPLIYSGYNASYTSGHAWVCDGYSDNYFHFNWGWGGTYNGNFLLSLLNPGSYNFSYDQSALFSIEPVIPSSITIPYAQGFESGKGAVSLMGVYAQTSEEAHTGSQSIRLGKESIASLATNAASLCFVVPADAELNFWVKRVTPSVSSTNQQAAYLMPQYGSTPLMTIYNGDFNDSSWVSYNVDLSAYTGQIVRLLFVQQVADFIKQQWMYIDDISISGISSNLAPYSPSAPIPSNGQETVTLTPTLRWNGGDPNGDALTYKIYFGTSSTPPLVSSSFTTNYTPPKLTHITTYYWKIIADDGSLTSESPVWSFTTKGIPPDVGNCGITNISSSGATICGQIINENGNTISSRGICWTETAIPSLSTEHKESAATPIFSSSIDGLKPYTVYNYCTYAAGNYGIGYSPVLSFRSLPDVPNVEIIEVSDILRSTATVKGKINRVNDASITKRGVVWSEEKGFDPSFAASIATEGNWADTGSFFIHMNNLPGPENFFVRVFAENSAGITYSDEMKFTTPNLSPTIDLDANNSKGAGGNDFLGKSTEQQPGGVVCDNDIVITDPDGDEIEKITIDIENPFNASKEILVVTSLFENLIVTGDSSGHIELTSTDGFSHQQWQNVLQKVEYLNLLDAPHAERQRVVGVRVFDGIDWSNKATAYINITPVNDPPTALIIPALNSTPVLGSRIAVVPGTWADLSDDCNGNYTFRYWWQAKDSLGNVEDIEPEDLFYLSIDESFCGKTVRIVEEATDLNCGGSNSANALATSEWTPVGKLPQSITIDNVPLHYFHERIFRISGNSSSGLPLTFGAPANSTLSISNDTVYMLNSGTVVISGIQAGNECYLPSPFAYKIVTIARGNQEIIYQTPIEAKFTDGGIPLPAYATSNLELSVHSSDSSIAYVENDSIFFEGIGDILLTLSQQGNKNYYPAASVEMKLTILKGDQTIRVDPISELRFGQPDYRLNAWSTSNLDVEMKSSNTSVVEITNNQLVIKGVGNTVLTLSQEGNKFWNPASVVSIPLTVRKGIQEIFVSEIGTKHYADQPFTPNFYSTSGLGVTYFISDTSLATIKNGEIHIKKAGETAIVFEQKGSELWESAIKEIPLLIEKANQVLSMEEIGSKVYGDRAIQLNAVASSGLPVTYETSDREVATVSGDSLIISNAGNAVITATQPGNENWNKAASISINLTVEKAEQSIHVALPDSILLSKGWLTFDASASSGLPVTGKSSDERVITIHSDSLLLLSEGIAILTFTQNGNRNYNQSTYEKQVVVYKPVSVTTIEEAKILIYPNPSPGIFHIIADDGLPAETTFKVTTSTGKTIISERAIEKGLSLDISGYPSGVYFVLVQTKSNQTALKLLLK